MSEPNELAYSLAIIERGDGRKKETSLYFWGTDRKTKAQRVQFGLTELGFTCSEIKPYKATWFNGVDFERGCTFDVTHIEEVVEVDRGYLQAS